MGKWRGLAQLGRKWLRQEFAILLAILAIVVGAWAFIEVTDEVLEGEYYSLDESVLRSLRAEEAPYEPKGPDWLEQAAVDVTALGGAAVLGMVFLAVSGWLLLTGARRQLMLVVVATAGGLVITHAVKVLVSRPRPMAAFHWTAVDTAGFPSGHAMNAAVVYLTLGAILARRAERRHLKVYIMVTALLVTLLVGVTRVYLGVHYPTDVLAGWAAGLAWAALVWLAIELLARWRDRRTGL